MTKLEQAIVSEFEAECYLENVSIKQFVIDCKDLMSAYSDNGVIDKAIDLLASCRTKEGL